MKLVVISPETDHPREREVLGGLLAHGLERYHVRKPTWSRAQLEAWLGEVPATWRSRLVMHQHHELARELGLGGVHFRDEPSRIRSANTTDSISQSQLATAQPEASPYPQTTSRSCHDLAAVRAALGHYDSVFFGPVFPSLSKPGYGPRDPAAHAAIAALLTTRTPAQRRTSVLALGGITPERVPEIRALGFDGIAVIGAVWHAADPVAAFMELQESLCCHAA